jgi:hypothetical protein
MAVARTKAAGTGTRQRSTRMTATLATRLRLSPQSRLDPKSVGRMRPYNGPRPWDDDFLDKREA